MKEHADLEPNKKPALVLAPGVINHSSLSDFQKRVLHELLFFANQSASADRLAHYMGYRPATRGRLAISSALRALLDPDSENGASGHYVVRLAPKDQWDSATWCLRSHCVVRLDRQNRPCEQEIDPKTHDWIWVVSDPAEPLETSFPKKKTARRKFQP
jgi:hypothetical protein